jgi:hypothetical protein
VSARVQLRYKLGHGALSATYEKFTSAGSGFFAGANTQAARFGYTRPLGRTWDFYGNLGYSSNKRLQNLEFGGVPVGVNASSYNEGSAGAVLRKHLGRTYDFFAAYRFDEVAFDTPGDTPVNLPGSSGTSAQRHVGAIGVEWHPTPTRIE